MRHISYKQKCFDHRTKANMKLLILKIQIKVLFTFFSIFLMYKYCFICLEIFSHHAVFSVQVHIRICSTFRLNNFCLFTHTHLTLAVLPDLLHKGFIIVQYCPGIQWIAGSTESAGSTGSIESPASPGSL